MDFRHISYFLAVAESGSFSTAAKRIHVSQPALSARIRDLEGELGVQLFFRHARGAELTEEGRRLLPYAQEVDEALRRAKQAFQEKSRSSHLVGITPTLGLYFLPELLQTCSAAGDLDLIVQQASATTLLSMIESGRIDFAICFCNPPIRSTVAVPLFEEDLVLIGRREVIGNVGETVAFDNLKEYPLVVEPRGHHVRKTLDEAALKRGVRLKIVSEVEPVATKLSLLMQSSVCAVAPDWVYRKELREGLLVACQIVGPSLTLKLNLMTRFTQPADVLDRFRTLVWSTVCKLAQAQPNWRLAEPALDFNASVQSS